MLLENKLFVPLAVYSLKMLPIYNDQVSVLICSVSDKFLHILFRMSFVFLGRSLNCALVRFGPCRVNHPRACSSSNFMTENEFDQRAEDTLHALTDFFDALPDKLQTHTDYDVSLLL